MLLFAPRRKKIVKKNIVGAHPGVNTKYNQVFNKKSR